MKFRINAEILASYINLVSRVVSAKSNLPILSNVLIEVDKEKMRVTGTDLEIQISAIASLSAQEEGKTTVNAKLFSQYINSIPKEESIEVKEDKNTLVVSSTVGAATFSLKEPDDFPLFEEGEAELLFEIPKDTLAMMIEKTAFASAKDDIRPILTGINVEVEGSTVTMVALDTFRLSKISVPIQNKVLNKKQFVVSSFALENVSRIIRDAFISATAERDTVTFKLAKAGNFIVIEYGDVSIFARLIEGDYPEYKQVIPAAHQTEVHIEKNKLADSLKRVGVFAQSAQSQRVILSFDTDKLTMEAVVPEIGNVREEIPVTIEGDAMKISFNMKYLSDIVSNISDETIVFRAINKTSPGLFVQPSLDSFLHIMMPLKLED